MTDSTRSASKASAAQAASSKDLRSATPTEYFFDGLKLTQAYTLAGEACTSAICLSISMWPLCKGLNDPA
eukprot:CAMPEP_0113282638 /NCGR_PEP_ID=MMETSP0008_2-20120614/28982_1 /TAXON_ID=97485 /ORGANISM="Prymnesium parvum" /LENGTH=69 /DNA_ID=CAMNT_0000133217 /DNA_START=486 /DNA_END=695 /DNA_ORIENTATION=- /assembly_acc=CAM_ASM_000153